MFPISTLTPKLVLILTFCDFLPNLYAKELNLCDVNNTVTSYILKNENFNCGCPNNANCIRKCCADNFFVQGGVCTFNDSVTFIVPLHRKNSQTEVLTDFSTNVLIGDPNCSYFYAKFTPGGKDAFYVQDNGQLWYPHYKRTYENSDYCVDNIDGGQLSVFVCFDDDENEGIRREFNIIGMIISMPFLLATFVIYALFPERNLHMKALMFYVFSLFMGYLTLVIIQLYPYTFERPSCITIAMMCIFFFMLSFLWMNVICIDIWFAFSGLRSFSRSSGAERKRFMIYIAYAWGLAILHFIILLSINETSHDEWYAPRIGNGMCFIAGGHPEALYFYGPMAVIIITNIILFSLTALKIRQVKKDTSMLKKDDSKRHTYENDKQKFNLYLKLFLAMGVNWTMEVISWAIGDSAPKYIWVLTDFCNAMYGVFIFFIFVFKKSTWKLLKKRYYTFIGKPQLAHTMTTNASRTTTSYCSAEMPMSDVHAPKEEMSLTRNSIK